MRATTVRFTEDLWEMLEREAADQGTSAAQLIREATILRIAAMATRRGDAELLASVEELAERSRKRRSSKRDGDTLKDPERLAAVYATGLFEKGASPRLDRLADMARRVVDSPVSLVTLIDADRQVFLASPGLKEPWASRGGTPNSYGFCKAAIIAKDTVVVNDARRDPSLATNPAINEMGVTAYLGVPLMTHEGRHAVGTLCVIDEEPRTWTDEQVEMIETLAGVAADHLEEHATAT